MLKDEEGGRAKDGERRKQEGGVGKKKRKKGGEGNCKKKKGKNERMWPEYPAEREAVVLFGF